MSKTSNTKKVNITFTNTKNAKCKYAVTKKSIGLSTIVISNSKLDIIKQANRQGVRLDYKNIELIEEIKPLEIKEEKSNYKTSKQVNPDKKLVTSYSILQLRLDIAKHNRIISEKTKKELEDAKQLIANYKNSVLVLNDAPIELYAGTQYNAMDIDARQIFSFYYLSIIELNQKEDILYKSISSVKKSINDAIKDIEDNMDTPDNAIYTIEDVDVLNKKLVSLNNNLLEVRTINKINKCKVYDFLPKGLYNSYVNYINELKNTCKKDIEDTNAYKNYFRCIYQWFVSMDVKPSKNEIDRIIRLLGIAGSRTNLRKNKTNLTYIFTVENFVNNFVSIIVERLIKQKVINIDVIKSIKCTKIEDNIINILADKIINFYNGDIIADAANDNNDAASDNNTK